MKRLTVHLKRVKKELVDGKYKINNTLSFMVNDEKEAASFVSDLENKKPRNNVSKWYLSNVR